MGAERLEVWIRLHVVEVVVAEKDRSREGVDRVIGAPRTRERAREVVAGQEVFGLELDDPAIEINRASDEAFLADELGKHTKSLDRLRRSGEKLLEEVDVEIELAKRTEPGGRLSGTDAATDLPGTRIWVVGRGLRCVEA